MMDFNRVMLIGTVTKMSEPRTLYNGVKALNIRVVTAKNIRPRSGVENFARYVTSVGVELFGKNAEACEKSLHLKDFVYVEGWLKEDHWLSKDGQEKFELVVNCERIQFLGQKNEDEME